MWQVNISVQSIIFILNIYLERFQLEQTAWLLPDLLCILAKGILNALTYFIRGRNCLLLANIWVHPLFLVRSVLLIFLVFYVVLCFCSGVVYLRPVSCVPKCCQCPLGCSFLIALSVFSNVYLFSPSHYFHLSLKMTFYYLTNPDFCHFTSNIYWLMVTGCMTEPTKLPSLSP